MNQKSDILKAFYHHFNALKYKSESLGEYYLITYKIISNKFEDNFISQAIKNLCTNEFLKQNNIDENNFSEIVIEEVCLGTSPMELYFNFRIGNTTNLLELKIPENDVIFNTQKHSNPCDNLSIKTFQYHILKS